MTIGAISALILVLMGLLATYVAATRAAQKAWECDGAEHGHHLRRAIMFLHLEIILCAILWVLMAKM